jgi:superfamily II DNA or RNA helicase
MLDKFAERQKGRGNPVRILIADQYETIWQERQRDQQIWVGTFNALHRLLQIEPPAHRDFYGREAQAAAASMSNLEAADDGDATEEFRDLIRSADLVIVDEGHHEPAYSWAQAVRSLGKPTVVLSATPYRNDYKYFELSGRFVFNLSWEEAVKQQRQAMRARCSSVPMAAMARRSSSMSSLPTWPPCRPARRR